MDEREEGGRRWRIAGEIALLAGLGLAVPLAVAWHYGALSIPRGDDWSYLLTLFRFVGSGRLRFNNWVSMTLVGQVVIAAPIVAVFGRRIALIQVLTATLGVAGLVAVLGLGQRILRSRRWALAVAACMAIGPLWGVLAISYMTDVPAFAFSMLATLLAVIALQRWPVALGMIAGALALGFVAFTIRQYAVIVIVSILLAAGWEIVTRGDRRVWRLAAAGTIAVAGSIAFYLAWSTVPGLKAVSPSVPDAHTLKVAVIKGAGFVRLTGLLLSPIVLLAGPIGIVRRAWASGRALTLVTGLGTALWLAGTGWRYRSSQFVGNYVAADGALSNAVLPGHRPDLLPDPGFEVLAALASLLGLFLVLAAVPAIAEASRRVRGRDLAPHDPAVACLGLGVLGYVLAYGAGLVTGLQSYDRYVLPALPLVALLVLRQAERDAAPAAARVRSVVRMRTALVGGAFVLLAALGLTYAVDSASFDGTRWRVARAAVDEGWASRQVNGGFEWVNYHRGRKILPGDRPGSARPGPFGIARYCVALRVDPEHVQRDRVVAWGTYQAPTRESVRIVALRSNRPCLRIGDSEKGDLPASGSDGPGGAPNIDGSGSARPGPRTRGDRPS